MALEILAGLALFLYGVSQLSDGMGTLAGDRLKQWLGQATVNVWAGILTGTVATACLQSSSVTIILVIALVNARLLTFGQALGVVMGSNVGTALSSQLFAFSVEDYAPLALMVGLVLSLLAKSDQQKARGQAIVGIGLVFFGLKLMGEAVAPLKDSPEVYARLARLEAPWKGILAGGVLTLIIQSSSATAGIAITLAKEGLLSLQAGVAVILGAEIGTCSDTLIAGLGRSRAAIRTGVFHLFFNILTVLLGGLLIGPFIGMVEWISGGSSLERKIANAHLLFNGLGVLLLVGLTPWMARVLLRLVPEKQASDAQAG